MVGRQWRQHGGTGERLVGEVKNRHYIQRSARATAVRSRELAAADAMRGEVGNERPGRTSWGRGVRP